MACKKIFTCDVCGKPIEDERERLFMVTMTVKGHSYKYDDGSDDWERTYHVHNDKLDPSENCFTRVFEQLKAVKRG